MRKFLLFVSFIILSVSVFAQVPTITSFSPASAEVGASVTITGTNFDATPANNIVYFGSVKATVTAATTTSLTVTVPAGSTYESIAVINIGTGRQAKSKTSFKVINNSIASITVGVGSFVAPIDVTASSGASNWYEIGDMISVADFDGDGKPDIAKGSNTTSVNVLRNEIASPGTIVANSFSNAGNFTTGSASFEIASGDIDGDGKIDIVSVGTSNFSILRNTSTSGSISFANKVDVSASFRYRVKLADIDGDGRLDVVTSGNYSSNFNVYLNTSSVGSISFNATPTTITGLSGSRHITVGDVNMDGKTDVIAANEGTSNALLFLNTSTTGTVSFGSGIAVAGGYWYNLVGDFDGDGKNDILSNGANVSLLRNNYSSGTFTSSNLTLASNISPADGLSYNALSDFNGDGKLDYFTSFQNSGQSISWYKSNYTSGNFSSSSFSGFSNSFSTPYQMIICDFDGDAKQDILSSASSNAFVQIARNKIGEEPTINITGSLSPFTKCGATASTAQTISVNGSYLTANISIAALTGYEYSTDGSTYASTLSLSQSSGSVSSTVYVRLSAGSSGSPAGNIVFSSNGATSVNLAATGTANSVRPFNQALNFDGSNDKVSIPNNSLHQLSNGFTIEAWVKVDPSVTISSTTRMGIATKVIWSSSGLGYGLDIDGGKARVFSGQGWNDWGGVSAPTNITTNTWVHLAGTYNGSIFRLYVDGQEVSSNSSSTGIPTNTQPFTIGSWPNENKFFKGDIDEVRIWNVVRTASQISQSKDIELNGSETGLVSYYNFNQGTPSGINSTVTFLSDATSNGLNGTLNSFGLTGATSNWIAGGPMILNDPSMCINGSTTLSHTNTGGTWSTSDANIISIDQSTGIATAVAVGSATITYSYSVNGCPFTSTKVFAVSQTPVAPSATTSVNYCRNATATALTATAAAGNTLQWYTVATGGTPSSAPTPSTTTLGSTFYYVSQKTNAAGCEGPRTTITVSINPNTSITTQPTSPSAVCLNANSNTISVTAAGGNLTYQWYTNTSNSTTGATAITNATSNSYVVPTNVAATKYYYVVVSGTCGSSVTSSIVSQVVNISTFSTEPSSSAQNLEYGGTATALTVASPGATAYQWYSTPTKPSLLDGFTGTTGFTSSTGAFQTLSGNSGQHPAINAGVLTFAYIDGSSVYRDFNLDQSATTVSFSTEYAETDRDNNKNGDVGKIQLQFFNASNTQVGTTVESPQFTGTLTFQSVSLSNVSIPNGATKVRVIFFQVNETEFWAGNYGIAFRNPSVTTDVALNGTAITGATSATYTPSTSTPGALYYYAVATGGCSTATSALSGLITVGKATPTIASMAAINKTFGDAAFTLTVPTSNATGAFTFASSNTAVATISGTTVTIVGAGTATITATQATDANYNAGSVTALLTVAKANPTIASMAAISKTFGDAAFGLTAPTSNSTGAITYTSSNTSVATISGSTVTIVGAGTATITATQAASNNYNAGSVTTTLTVAKANPTIAVQPNITRAYGSAAVTLVAPSSNSNGAFSYTISDASVATISGATLTAVGIGTATITTIQAESANYNAGSVTRTITVVKGTPTYGTFAAINKTFGDAEFTLTAPISTSTGAFTYASDNTSVATVSGAIVTIVGAGTANITATQAADANYNAGSVTAVLNVAKAARTLSAFADINKTTTDAPFTLIAPVSSAGTGAITYASSNTAVATISGSNVTITGIGTSIITATQAADANYLAATISATLTVILGDSDGDGVPDDVEVRDGTDPNNPSSVKDSDGDGVPDFVEIGNGTNPNSPSDAIDSDGDGLSDYYEARNSAPTNITLSATTVNENNTAGAAIVDVTATDVNIGEAFTYTLVSGTGDTDNASFTISGASLRAVNSFDFETRTTYSLRLRVTDKGGLSFEKEFVITVANVNEAPTALTLSNASVLENAASGTTVGTLAGTDADAGDTHTYTLVTGTGSTDNASFTITGTTLSTAAVFNFEAKNSYSVRVRVTDAGGLSFERVFTISVTDVNEAPTLTAITDRRVYNVSTSQVVNLAGITAGPETAQSTTTTVSTDRPATFSSISVVGTQIQFTLAPGIVTPQDVVVTVRVRDNGGVANGGVDSVVRTFRLGIDPMPVASATPNLITLGATSQLSAAGANAVNYTWVAVGGSGIVGSGATINVRPAGTTTYAVVVTNSFGYQATIPVLLTVIVDYKLVPNNLVTPNGDGVNDRWVIPNIDMYPDNEVMVYDKAGRAVFAKRGYNNEWDGTVNGKKLKEDAYFYVIKFNKDGALPIRGYLSIVR